MVQQLLFCCILQVVYQQFFSLPINCRPLRNVGPGALEPIAPSHLIWLKYWNNFFSLSQKCTDLYCS